MLIIPQRAAIVLASFALGACTSAGVRPRISTLGCVQSVLAQLPAGLHDKQAHCLASGLISRYCSRAEANFAALGKEIADLFSAGDADWADWRADRAGIRCASQASSDDAVGECCRGSSAASEARIYN